METSFQLEIVGPTRKVVSQQVSEVVLPAHDGEVGVLGNHEDFVGLLGTGPLKYVSGGNDFWLMVSSGAYYVKSGALTIVAEQVEEPKDIAVEKTRDEFAALEKDILDAEKANDAELRRKYLRAKARLDVYRRASEVN